MSHPENKVEWGIKKAKKELENNKKHRGLVKIDENKEKSKEHLHKAVHNLSAVSYFNQGGFSD